MPSARPSWPTKRRVPSRSNRRGALDQVFIHGKKGYVVLMSVGLEAVLTVLAREQAKLGLIMLDMRRAAEDLGRLV